MQTILIGIFPSDKFSKEDAEAFNNTSITSNKRRELISKGASFMLPTDFTESVNCNETNMNHNWVAFITDIIPYKKEEKPDSFGYLFEKAFRGHIQVLIDECPKQIFDIMDSIDKYKENERECDIIFTEEIKDGRGSTFRTSQPLKLKGISFAYKNTCLTITSIKYKSTTPQGTDSDHNYLDYTYTITYFTRLIKDKFSTFATLAFPTNLKVMQFLHHGHDNLLKAISKKANQWIKKMNFSNMYVSCRKGTFHVTNCNQYGLTAKEVMELSNEMEFIYMTDGMTALKTN